jgi:hypothetical protein
VITLPRFLERETTLPLLMKIVLPAFTGAVLGGAAILGLVWSQTQAPAENPALNPVLTYGDR